MKKYEILSWLDQLIEVKNGNEAALKKLNSANKKRAVLGHPSVEEELKLYISSIHGGKASLGIEPELFVLGVELSIDCINKGITKYSDFTKRLTQDMGNIIQPYMKSFYEAVRYIPSIVESGANVGMTSYEEVRDSNFLNTEVKKNDVSDNKELVRPPEKSKEGKSNQRDYTKFSIDGKHFYPKKKFPVIVIQKYVKDHPNVTIEDLEKVFPSKTISKQRGVVRSLAVVNRWIKGKPDIAKRYSLKKNEIISLRNGEKVVVYNQWGTNHFPKFLMIAKALYKVQSDKPYDYELLGTKQIGKQFVIEISQRSLESFGEKRGKR